jgi:ribosomal protein L32E
MSNEKNLPTFRGRFGTRSKRKKSIAKWDKWRHPRGIDITFRKGDNQKPRIGYGTKKEDRDLHPSGRIEVYVRNLDILKNHVKENKDANKYIYRLAGNIGAKKRLDIKEFAKTAKIRIIN